MKNLLELATAIGIGGFLHCDELQALVELAAGQDVLEVGAFCGLSAWGMGISARTVRSVDTFRAATDGQRQTGQMTTFDAYNLAISRYKNVSYFIGTSEDAARLLHDDYDLIFLDATHTYEEVKADTERWWPRVRDGGVMAWHDYHHDNYPGVAQAVEERFGPLPNRVVTLGWIEKGGK